MRRYLVLAALSVLALVLGACAPSAAPLPTATSAPSSSPTPESPTPLPASPTPAETAMQLWNCAGCGGDSLWAFGDGEPHLISVPLMYAYYGYSPANNQILYAVTPPTEGSGPSNISASDLALHDLDSGETSLLQDQGVVEALFAPNGLDIAYILATPETYELHWLAGDGSDRVLARDVTFAWSIAPSGAAVAFTRESRYELPIDPGVYVVSVESGAEVKVSDVDNAGWGSSADAPVWSPDSRELIIAHWAGEDDPRLVLAQADGSAEVDLTIDPVYADMWWSTVSIPSLLWAPDGDHLVGSPSASAEPYGPSPILYYRLDRTANSLRDIVLLAEAGTPALWDIPGQSVWILDNDGRPARLALP